MRIGFLTRLASPVKLRRCILPHRIIRSATLEGMADQHGMPHPKLAALYLAPVRECPGTLITGMCAVSAQGRSMHQGQAGIWDDTQAGAWRGIVDTLRKHSPESKLFMQLTHAGRQTLETITGLPVKGASTLSSPYFRQRVQALSEDEVYEVVTDFAYAAQRARRAGFDGIQLQAGHGDLLHQFISSYTNTRTDSFEDTGLLLELVIEAIREGCGPDFPVLVKVSGADDLSLTPEQIIPVLERVQDEVDAVEVSYGTMDYPLNIVRGNLPLEAVCAINPVFTSAPKPLLELWKRFKFPFVRKRFLPFTSCYNALPARVLQKELNVPVIPSGGIHSLEDMRHCLEDYQFPAVALSRPFICEPDLVPRLRRGEWPASRCTRCNLCVVHCDAPGPVRCYRTTRKA